MKQILILLLAAITQIALGNSGESPVRAALARGDYERVAELLQKVSEASLEQWAARCELARAKGRYQKALELAQRVWQESQAPDAAVEISRAATAMGDHQKALVRLKEALQLAPQSVQTRVELVRVARIVGDETILRQQSRYFFALFRRTGADDAVGTTACAFGVQDDDPKGAWNAYQDAQQADPSYLPAFVLGGEACAQSLSWEFATECYNKALALNPRHPDVLAGAARVAVEQGDYSQAQEQVESVLTLNPRHVAALRLQSRLLWLGEEYTASRAALERALETNPKDVESVAWLAAWYDGRQQLTKRDATIAKAISLRTNAAGVYVILARAAERRYQFDRMELWGRKAMLEDPANWAGKYLAAVALLRQGEEDEGRKLLDEAFSLNRFNLWAYNMLTVLDKEYDARKFLTKETEHFVVRLDKQEAKVLWPYLAPALEEIWDTYTVKYGLEPVGPRQFGGKVLVIFHPTHQDFSARITGLPGLGALGVCFGQVILLPSPRSSKFGTTTFNWREVLRHEFLHVLTLQATDYLVPRWFTEGISQFEESNAGTDMDDVLVDALMADELRPIQTLNAGLTLPKSRQSFSTSYAYSREVCRYIVNTYGFPALLNMLRGYKERTQTSVLVPDTTGATLAEFNDGVRLHMKQILRLKEPAKSATASFEALLELPEDSFTAVDWGTLAAAYLDGGDGDEARRAADRALALDKAQPQAARVRGIMLANDEPERAVEYLDIALKAHPDDYQAAMIAARLAAKAEQKTDQIRYLQLALDASPRCVGRCGGAYLPLATVLRKSDRADDALSILERLTAIHTSDAKAYVMMAELLAEKGHYEAALTAYENAIDVSPYEVEIHAAAMEVALEVGDRARTRREATAVLALAPRTAECLVVLADILLEEKDYAEAAKIISRLRRVDRAHAKLAEFAKRLAEQ
ncbi:MAG TPA: hypothetical protein DCR55_17405 [Lentisphaeria bacterium]|nr:hypothetical protein [Lentisphaeria bacterium]